ncbi:hypothetical protein Moror_14530 [Moniliophthora roreri MCA 2997]|uniref:Uncharacterized protein n=1 Tax=Moniliophthora roreri (strain MCA 2997) TaxID=1381753 RepID=V2YNR6_MONRO|nr:hypothetical protein Moror_14530 [Moniliophthora roreri MCA 2997]
MSVSRLDPLIMSQCEALSSVTDVGPSLESDRDNAAKLVDTLLEWLRSHPASSESLLVARCITYHTIVWKNKRTFREVIRACHPNRIITTVGVFGLEEGYKRFGWSEPIEDLLTQAVLNDVSAVRRGDLLSYMLQAAAKQKDEIAIAWCLQYIDSFFENLQKIEIDDIQTITYLVFRSRRDWMLTLCTYVLPLLFATQLDNMELWRTLFAKLKMQGRFILRVDDFSAITNFCIQFLADHWVPLQALPLERIEEPVGRTVDFIHLCLQNNAKHALGAFFQHLWNHVVAHHIQADSAQYYSQITKMDGLSREFPGLEDILKPVFGHAFQCLLRDYFVSHSENGLMELGEVMDHLCVDDLVDSLEQWYVEQTNTLATPLTILNSITPEMAHGSDMLEYIATLANDICARIGTYEETDRLQRIINKCLSKIIGGLDLSALSEEEHPTFSLESCELFRSLNLLYFLGRHQLAYRVLDRCLSCPEIYQPAYICGLTAVLKRLPSFLQPHGLSLLDEPYAYFAGEVIKKIIQNILGPNPCPKISPAEWKAVKNQMINIALRKTRVWGVSLRTAMDENGRCTLQVDRPQHLNGFVVWLTRLTEVQELLPLLGDDRQQMKVVGKEFEWLIHGGNSIDELEYRKVHRRRRRA